MSDYFIGIELRSNDRGLPTSMSRSRVTTTAAISLALLLFSLSVVYSQNYEPTTTSVVEGFVIGWVFLFVSIGIGGYVAIFRHRQVGTIETIGIMVQGVGSLAFVTAFPYLTGYYMLGRSDTMVHLGWIRDILQLETITPSLIYPVFHLLSASTSLVAGIDPRWSMVVTIIVTLLGTSAAMVAVACRLLEKIKPPFVIWGFVMLVLLALPFRTYHLSYYPAGLSTLYLPIAILTVYLVLEGKSRLVAMIVFVFTALTHPLGLINVLLLLGVIAIATWDTHQFSPPSWVNPQLVVPASFVVFIFGFLWYDYSGTVGHVTGNMYTSLFVDTGSGDNVEHTSSTLQDLPIVEFILLRYSPHVYLLPVTAILPVILFSKKKSVLRQFAPLYIWGTASMAVGTIAFMSTSIIGPLRFLDVSPAVWVSIFALLYLGISYDVSLPTSTTATTLIFILLLVSLPITLVTGFPTALTYQTSMEVSHEDKSTAEWWMEYGDKQYTESLGLGSRIFYSSVGFNELSEYNPSGELRSQSDRAGVFDREQLKIQRVEVGEDGPQETFYDDQLIIITGWHTSHADNSRLINNRNMSNIHERYNQDGIQWLYTTQNKVYSDGRNGISNNPNKYQ